MVVTLKNVRGCGDEKVKEYSFEVDKERRVLDIFVTKSDGKGYTTSVDFDEFIVMVAVLMGYDVVRAMRTMWEDVRDVN